MAESPSVIWRKWRIEMSYCITGDALAPFELYLPIYFARIKKASLILPVTAIAFQIRNFGLDHRFGQNSQ
jgi:hypothetical protein